MIQTPTLSEHRVDGHKGADEFDERGNIFGFEAAAVSVDLCCFQFADAKNFSVFPNPGVRICAASRCFDLGQLEPLLIRSYLAVETTNSVVFTKARRLKSQRHLFDRQNADA